MSGGCGIKRVRVTVAGRVQGMGFRPAVFNLASLLGLGGWVKNSGEGLEIEVEGEGGAIEDFLSRLRTSPPRGARVSGAEAFPVAPEFCSGFKIAESSPGPAPSADVSPDIGICSECADEVNSPGNRRHLYPFTNCTACGPRWTIITGIPYDRARTAMRSFIMCAECEREYSDPGDRRFHAQPVACPACGPEPEFSFTRGAGPPSRGSEALGRARDCLLGGELGAVKGLGGFHLVCDAKNPRAAGRLREGKKRGRNPFALMAGETGVIRRYCVVSPEEERLLSSPESPVVLLERREGVFLPEEIAPSSRRLGFMLPYTPLHLVLFSILPPGSVLVATSGNVSGEPIAYENMDAVNGLSEICDFFLFHDREIHAPCDDSVAAVIPRSGREYVLRRSRGYVPEPVFLNTAGKFSAPEVFAAGGDMKNTFCFSRGAKFTLSQHIGDLGNLKSYNYYSRSAEHFKRIFGFRPEVFACDLHPGYISTAYAVENSPSPPVRVQHHHAHLASCMAENGLPRDAEIIGVAFDGTGYGPDGNIWGGEFFTAGYTGFKRQASFRPFKLPGGEKAVKEPWRTAVSLLREVFGSRFEDFIPACLRDFSGEKIPAVAGMLDAGINCPATSSAGRLFDGVSALLGLCASVSYEGEAAAVLEAAAGENGGEYEFALENSGLISVDYSPFIRQLALDIKDGGSAAVISGKFHGTLAAIIRDVCVILRDRTGINEVALSGGVFQNLVLLSRALPGLEEKGFRVYTHSRVPANDGGLSLGQAAVASVITGGR